MVSDRRWLVKQMEKAFRERDTKGITESRNGFYMEAETHSCQAPESRVDTSMAPRMEQGLSRRTIQLPFEDLAATIYDRLGVDPKKEYLAPSGRPIRLSNNGTPIGSPLVT